MKSTRIDRRVLLTDAVRRLGAVTIGLPLLEETMIPSVAAAPAATVPVRAFNLFFGLGIPAPHGDRRS